jgi:hypothetical protein
LRQATNLSTRENEKRERKTCNRETTEKSSLSKWSVFNNIKCAAMPFFFNFERFHWPPSGIEKPHCVIFLFYFPPHTRNVIFARNLKKERKRWNVEKQGEDIFRIVWIFFFFSFLKVFSQLPHRGEIKGMLLLLFLFCFSIWVFLYSSMGRRDGSFGSLSVVSRVVQDSWRRTGGDCLVLGIIFTTPLHQGGIVAGWC